MLERRKEERCSVPEIYRQYITFKLREASGEFVPTDLLEFSPHGIRITNPRDLPVDTTIECLVSIPRSLSREIPFIAKVKYSVRNDSGGDYLIGAEIVQIEEPIWFDVFLKTHDFIKERIGDIY